MSDDPVTAAGPDLAAIDAERDRLRSRYLLKDRPASSARGVHHVALLSSDAERTIRFYQSRGPAHRVSQWADCSAASQSSARILGGVRELAHLLDILDRDQAEQLALTVDDRKFLDAVLLQDRLRLFERGAERSRHQAAPL